MFSSRIIDNTNYCNIIKHSLKDDLYPYTVDSNMSMIYESKDSVEIESQFGELEDLINLTKNPSDYVWYPVFVNNDEHIATKALSSLGSYSNGNSSLTSGRIGIENFYSFTPKFKSWETTAGLMSVDWILNNYKTPYAVYYGIMCWFRKFPISPKGSSGILLGKESAPISSFPNGSRLVHTFIPDKIYIKLSNEKLLSLSINSREIVNNKFDFLKEEKGSIVNVSDFPNSSDQGPKFKLANFYNTIDDRGVIKKINFDSLSLGKRSGQLWVPDGDFFAYYDSEANKIDCESKGLPPKSYISSPLYKKYTAIYRVLTLDEKRSFSTNLKKLRLYKKLAHILSTSPFVNDYCISFLDSQEIKNYISEYFDSLSGDTTTTDLELEATKNLLLKISKYFQKLFSDRGDSVSLDHEQSFLNFNNNLITSPVQLFNKLISKYGADLRLDSGSTATISAKKDVLKFDNRGIAVTQVTEIFCDKNQKNTTIINNQTINFDTTQIKTNLAQNKSEITVGTVGETRQTSIPIIDFVKPRFDPGVGEFCPSLVYKDDSKTDADKDDYIFKTTSVTVFSADTGDNLIRASESAHCTALIDLQGVFVNGPVIPRSFNEPGVLQEQPEAYLENTHTSCTWQIVSGPPARFVKESQISIESEVFSNIGNVVQLLTNYTGKFVVECTLTSPFGIYKKQRTIYVVDARLTLFIGDILAPNINYGKYWDSKTLSWKSPPGSSSVSHEFSVIPFNKDNIFPLISKFNKVAISNKAKVFWPIQTDFEIREGMGYSGDAFITTWDKISKLDKDYKFSFVNDNFQNVDNANFSIVFDAQDTFIKINAIFLERIRSDDEKCSQCLSLYLPHVRTKKTTIATGGSSGGSANLTEVGAANKTNVLNIIRTNKYPDGFDLVEYIWDASTQKGDGQKSYKTISHPKISTSIAPKIKSYGGYSEKFIRDIGIDINSHPRPLTTESSGIAAKNPFLFPSITGFKLDYKNTTDPTDYQFCYQKAISLTPTTGYIIPFSKGVFHPATGWAKHGSQTYRIHANRCGVLKFNPGARDTFSFIGPSLSKIEATKADLDSNTVETKIFSSSITLNLANHIQWAPECGCGEYKPEQSIQNYNANQTHKEYIDIDNNISNHGYRVLHGGKGKDYELNARENSSIANDEFLLQQSQSNYTYSFAVTGPSSLSGVQADETGRIHIRNPRVNGFGIKDVEIKLNFLNYVNTKNLVVWLEAEFCDQENEFKFGRVTDLNPSDAGKPRGSPIKSGKQFVDQPFDYRTVYGNWREDTSVISGIQNDSLADYLTAITQINSYDSVWTNAGYAPENKKMKLYLLNQEYIQNNDYNFSIKFSDSSSKYNVLSDNNVFVRPIPGASGHILGSMIYPESESPVNISPISGVSNGYKVSNIQTYQNIIKTNNSIQPTICPNNYSDRESCLYSNIIKFNKLNITNNTLNKFVSSLLFRNAVPLSGPCEGSSNYREGDYAGTTVFSLKMMVLDESDDMSPSDNIISSQYFSGLETVDVKRTSTQIFNSLCNWELILHVGDTPKPVPHSIPSLYSYGSSDVLSLIDYGKEPSYPGNSFIADLSAYKHLLPLANINAPYNCVSDYNPCLGRADDPTGQGLMVRPTEFPSWVISIILATIAGFAGLTGGTLVGALVGLSVMSVIMNIATSYIVSWFGEISYIQALEDTGRQIYFPSFAKYNFGSSEKLLINFRKPGGLWYTAESSFFKYHNTPILKPNRYKFTKIDRVTNSPNISKFGFSVVDNYDFLIDNKYITKISAPITSLSSIQNPNKNPPFIINNNIINGGDIVDISFYSTSIEDSSQQVGEPLISRFVFPNKKGQSCATGVAAINSGINYLQNNAVLGLDKIFDDNLITNISGSKVAFIKNNRIPYDMFSVDDNVVIYNEDGLGSCSGTIATIKKKGLIFKNNQYNTVLIFDVAISGGNALSPTCDSNIFMCYKNETTVEHKKSKLYNTWSFDHEKGFRHKLVSELSDMVTHSVGSYGDLSIFLDKNKLSNNIFHNQLPSIYDIYNNRENDKIKFNKIKFIPTKKPIRLIPEDKDFVGVKNENVSTQSSVVYSGSSYGFVYSERDEIFHIKDVLANYLQSETNILSETKDDEVIKFLKNQVGLSSTNTNEFANNNKFCFIKLTDPYISGIRHGELEIENDYSEHIPLAIINDSDIETLSGRLELIESETTTTFLDSALGNKDKTNDIIRSSQLFYLYKHYALLGEDNPECYVNDGSGQPKQKYSCYKLLIQQKIDQLLKEQRDIIELLDTQTIATVNVTYTNQQGVESSADGEIVYENNSIISLKNSSETQFIISKASIKKIKKTYKSRSKLNINDPRYLDPGILPKIEAKIEINSDNSLSITYSPANYDHYWLNIDPNQSCLFDFASNPKVLVSTQYACIPTNGNALDNKINPFDHNVCPQFLDKSPLLGQNNTANNAEYVTIDSKNIASDKLTAATYKYHIPENKIQQQKTDFEREYPAITGWKLYTKTRFFNVNGDLTLDNFDNQDICIESIETYFIPQISVSPPNDGTADTNTMPGLGNACDNAGNSPAGYGLIDSLGTRKGVATRVGNIINLSDTNNIEVMIKKIPRMLRGVDLLSTIYRYGAKDIYRQASPGNPKIPLEIDYIGVEGALNNSIYCWHCLQKDGNKFNYVDNLPLFFRLQNEMIFRSFFGSVDRIENKTEVLVSQFPWEMIPYEYDSEAV